RLAIKALLGLQSHEREAKWIVAHRIGNVAADTLRQQEIIEPDLQTSQSVLIGNVVDRTVAQNCKIGWHAHEFARIDIDPNTEHALLAPHAQGLAGAGYGHHQIVRWTQRTCYRFRLDGAEQHQLFANKVRGNGHAMI